MTTVEKMIHIKKLVEEVESEVRETARRREDVDWPLYRMLTEGCADRFKHMSKDLSTGYTIESWEKQLWQAYKLIWPNSVKL